MIELSAFFEAFGGESRFIQELHIDLLEKHVVHYVAQGKIDLFFVRKHADGRTGALRYFNTVHAGQIIPTHSVISEYPEWQLIGKPSLDGKLITVTADEFALLVSNEDLQPEVNRLMSEWINSLIHAVVKKVTTTEVDNISSSGLELKAGQSVFFERQRVVWVEVLSGSTTYCDLDSEMPGLIPLNKSTWLTATTDAKLKTHSTVKLLEQKRFLTVWMDYYQAMLAVAAKKRVASIASESSVVKQRVVDSQQLYQNVTSQIASFFDDSKLGMQGLEFNREDSVVAACQMACHAAKMKLKLPKQTKGRNDKEKVSALLQFSNITMRQVALAGDWWLENHGPLIAFYEESQQAVAVIPDNKNVYQLFDLESGELTPVDKENALLLESFAQTVYRSLPEDTHTLYGLLKWSLKSCKKELMLLLMVAILSGLLNLVTPWATGKLYSVVIPEASYSLLAQLIMGLLAAAFGVGLFELTRSFTLVRVRGWLSETTTAAIWERLSRLPISFYKQYSAGDLSDRASGFNNILQQLLGVSAESMLDIIYAFFYFSLLFYYSAMLGLMVLGFLIIIFGITALIISRNVKHERTAAKNFGKLSGMLGEYVGGVQKIRTTASESRVYSNWSKLFLQYRACTFKSRQVGNVLTTLNSMFPMMLFTAQFALVAYLMKNNEITLAEFLAFNSASTSLIMIIMSSSGTIGTLINLIPIYERAKPIVEMIPEVVESKVDPGKLTGAIEVDHVNFRYTESGPLILKDVSLEIEPDQFVAIVGPSGSGKSTLFRCLLRFESVQEGGIFYDNQDLSDLDINLVRRQIGVVLQNSALLPGSIFENIVGISSLTIEDAWHAARQASLDKDIEKMPMGMHTIISEGSGGLSGGQRQRLIIARALVHRPSVLYFDEATSALDNETQAVVSRSLSELKSTRVVIAHRLSTIIDADKIIVLKDGVVVEMGNYDELMKNKDVFYQMAKRQIV